MKIREGAYYRTRGGRIIGPMMPVDYHAKWKLAAFSFADGNPCWKFAAPGFADGNPCWTDEGRWSEFDDRHDMNIISEVYVSDTPPGFIPIGSLSVGGGGGGGGASTSTPAPEAKTLRDEFAMALAAGFIVNCTFETKGNTAADIYKAADAMIEARQK